MKLIPLNDWAVIKPVEAEVLSAGGLVIPDSAKEKPHEGIVEAIGPGAYEEKKHGKKKEEDKERKFIPSVVKPGERVLYERYAGQTYTIGDEERILVRERDILGILPEKPSRPAVNLPPLQIPAATSPSASTALVKTTAKQATVKEAKRSASKSGKRTAGKKAQKKAAKKAVTKKAVKPAKRKPSGGRKAGKKK